MFSVLQCEFQGKEIVLILQLLCDDAFGVVFENPNVSSLALGCNSPSVVQKELGLLMSFSSSYNPVCLKFDLYSYFLFSMECHLVANYLSPISSRVLRRSQSGLPPSRQRHFVFCVSALEESIWDR